MNCHISGKEAHLRKKKTRLEEKKAIQEDTPHPQKQHMRMFLQKKRNGGEAIPWGPSIALGAWLTALCGQQIIDWYLGLL